MGFMDELRKLTQPYDDEDDFFEGADESFKPQAQPQQISPQQALFESSFAAEESGGVQQAQPQMQAQPQQPKKPFFRSMGKAVAPKAPAVPKAQAPAAPAPEGSIFGNLGGGAKKAPKRERTVNFGGQESQVILFNPKSFDEAGEIVTHICQHRSVVMTLEGIPTDTARRLLDFISGIAFALQGKITPVSAKTYFVTPQNVDIVGAQTEQPESDSQYF